ncbi:MAG: alpha/beta hydrolase [Oscillospiraceae bacterium]|nr:alpha/beta hydrolase [Oscillospiraceae bacterium]
MLWNAKNGRVEINGSGMEYVSFGSGDKKLVILPGLSDGLATVEGKALMLAVPYRKYLKDFTVMMFSRPDPLPEGHSIRDMAEDQAAALRKLGIGTCSVLGVSQGGMIAQVLAAGHPEMVEKLVLAVSAPCVNEITRACVEKWISLAKKGDHKALMIDTAEKSYSETYLEKYRKLYPVIASIGRPKDYRRFLTNAAAILSFDASEELEKISCPTLIVAGKDDRIVGPEASYEMHERIAGSELHVYERLGHAAYEEAPDFNERVFSFLRS